MDHSTGQNFLNWNFFSPVDMVWLSSLVYKLKKYLIIIIFSPQPLWSLLSSPCIYYFFSSFSSSSLSTILLSPLSTITDRSVNKIFYEEKLISISVKQCSTVLLHLAHIHQVCSQLRCKTLIREIVVSPFQGCKAEGFF